MARPTIRVATADQSTAKSATDDLDEQLLAVAAGEQAEVARREEADADGADEAADEVDADDVERVVVARTGT